MKANANMANSFNAPVVIVKEEDKYKQLNNDIKKEEEKTDIIDVNEPKKKKALKKVSKNKNKTEEIQLLTNNLARKN